MWIEDQFCVIAGPCAVEKEEVCFEIASSLQALCKLLGFTYIFKASFDKANRTSLHSPRGPGLDEGLRTLESIRSSLGVRITTDIHEPWQAARVAPVVDLRTSSKSQRFYAARPISSLLPGRQVCQ